MIGQTDGDKPVPERQPPLGQRIRVNNIPVEIIGILESKGQSGGGMGQDRDDTIIGPLSMVRNRITGGNRWVSRHVSRIQFLVQDGYDIHRRRMKRRPDDAGKAAAGARRGG